MLDGGDDDVIALVAEFASAKPLIARLAASVPPEVMIRSSSLSALIMLGELFPGFLQSFADLEAVTVKAGGRAVGFPEIGEHGLKRFLENGSGRLVIEIDEALIHGNDLIIVVGHGPIDRWHCSDVHQPSSSGDTANAPIAAGRRVVGRIRLAFACLAS